MHNSYEIRFVAYAKRRIQNICMYRAHGETFADAIQDFLTWANSDQKKLDSNGRPFTFDTAPVTEKIILSIANVSY